MTDQRPYTTSATAQRAISFLQLLLAGYRPRDFAIRLWNGAKLQPEQGIHPRFTLVINEPSALRALVREPRELSIAEAYLRKDIDIEGDIMSVFDLADHLIDARFPLLDRFRLGMQLLMLPAKRDEANRRTACLNGVCHSRERDRKAITYHYDVSNDFYALWLDRDMVYSCAYFTRPEQDLTTAQKQKLDYLCRKLRLRPGERLLDVGCGWGGLIIHAVRWYGVKAKGITLSPAQADLAKTRIRREGLEARCSVELCDYRDARGISGFDKIVSVGMFEHVGEALLPEYFRKIWSLLKPGGVFLNHGIAANPMHRERRGPTFTDRYVFPDGQLLPISTTLRTAELNGFEVRDVESLREHYALTLRHWVRRLEENLSTACKLTDETTCRVWRLFMAASAQGFMTGRLNVYQTLLVKAGNGPSGLPLTRRDWYQGWGQ